MDENTQQTSTTIEETRFDCEKECPCEIPPTILCEEDTVIDEEEDKKIERITMASFSLAILAIGFTVAFAFSLAIYKSPKTKSGVLLAFLSVLCIIAGLVLWVFSYQFKSTYARTSFIVIMSNFALWVLIIFVTMKNIPYNDTVSKSQ